MENVSYVGMSRQLVLQREMEMTANNLANMSTPGYQSQNTLFVEYINKPQTGGSSTDTLHQVIDIASYRNLSPGAMSRTDNPLDFSIQGEGYFSIQTPKGTRYTRAGDFALNNQGQIVTKAGYPLMGDGGPITVPADATHISLSKDGLLSSEKGQIGKIKIISFDDQQSLKPTGENLFDGTKLQEKPVANPHVEQGLLEGSNVNPILEMNKMIEISRMYQSVQQMLTSDHQRQRAAIQQLTRV